jgi:hypothetical protein
VCEVLCRQVRAFVAEAEELLSGVADWVFEDFGERRIAWRLVDSLRRGFCAHWLDEHRIDDLAYSATDRCEHASRSVPLAVAALADRGR